jgi:HK97 family phage portal protein
MSFASSLRRLFEGRASKSGAAHPRDPVLAEWFGGGAQTLSGMSVTPESAMRVSAVYSAVRLLSDTLGWLPLIVYRRREEDGRDRDRGHPLYTILRHAPNRWQTAIEFKQMLMGHLCLRGNAYAEIVGDAQAAVRELIPLHPDRITPFCAPDGTIAYRHQPETGPQRILLQGEVFHLRGLGADGLTGLSPIAHHREGIGLAMALERHGAALFGNNAQPKFALKVPYVLTKPAAADLEKSWQERYRGVENAGKMTLLEGGMDVVQLGLNSEDAQFIESRKFSVSEIARMFRVPPHMIGDLEKATFSNIEHQQIEFVSYTIAYWAVIWHQAIRRDLLAPGSRETHFAEFLLEALLKGDLPSRYAAYAVARQWGWLSVNDIRQRENMNPIADGGDVYLSPMNMTPVDLLAEAVMQKMAPARKPNGSSPDPMDGPVNGPMNGGVQ